MQRFNRLQEDSKRSSDNLFFALVIYQSRASYRLGKLYVVCKYDTKNVHINVKQWESRAANRDAWWSLNMKNCFNPGFNITQKKIDRRDREEKRKTE